MSKTRLKHASYSIKKLMDTSKLSFATRHDYMCILKHTVKELDQLGFSLDNINQLKQKHFINLVDYWKAEALSNASMKNKMSVLRYACKLMNKNNVIMSNKFYELGARTYIPTRNKAITKLDLNKISNPYIKLSLDLQQHFGLRREECLKIIPFIADKGDRLELQASWTKGSIARSIPITNKEQRDCLARAKQFVGKKSLIPEDKNYIEQRNLYDRLTHEAGFFNLHGLRHAYAQKRYKTLTDELSGGNGWDAPINNGKTRLEMSESELKIDNIAREKISQALGHCRIAITKIYLG